MLSLLWPNALEESQGLQTQRSIPSHWILCHGVAPAAIFNEQLEVRQKNAKYARKPQR